MLADCRVTMHSGRKLRFDSEQPVEFPCGSLYRRDNTTAEGLQRCIEEEANARRRPRQWGRLRACGGHGCLDEDNPREKREVQEEHRERNTTAHIARVFDVCVGKNFHLLGGSPGRKFTGRAVCQGNNVKGQSGNWAIFREMAYTHASVDGPETWVELPPANACTVSPFADCSVHCAFIPIPGGSGRGIATRT